MRLTEIDRQLPSGVAIQRFITMWQMCEGTDD
jgi:hypothetical protein